MPGLRAGFYLCFFGIHALSPLVMDLLADAAGRSAGQPVHLSPVLAELARRERYLALEVSGQRYNIGVKYGLLTAQLALALDGVDREKILAQIVDLLAQRV
jgi:UTP--glucose-1-phosphate uridylyltransferase